VNRYLVTAALFAGLGFMAAAQELPPPPLRPVPPPSRLPLDPPVLRTPTRLPPLNTPADMPSPLATQPTAPVVNPPAGHH
jgi:hypothetical protein